MRGMKRTALFWLRSCHKIEVREKKLGGYRYFMQGTNVALSSCTQRETDRYWIAFKDIMILPVRSGSQNEAPKATFFQWFV